MADGPIIVFDGVCVLCSGSAQFVLRHDRAARFRLAAAQGEAGRALYRRFSLDADAMASMLLVDGDRVLTESDAVLAIARGLGWPWRLAGVARAMPRGARDWLYRFVAARRYRWFGRRDQCWIPAPAWRSRLLD